jgi:hypothetical protein
LKHRVSSPVIMLRNVLSLSTTLMRSPKMFITVSVLFGRQHSRYQMMTKGLTISSSWRVLRKFSFRNSNLSCNFVHKFPSVSSYTLSHMLDTWFIFRHRWATITGIIVNVVASILEASMPVIHLRFLFLYHYKLAATCLISPLVISAAKHKIWYSCVIQLQTFSTAMRPFAHCGYKQLYLCL